MPVPEHRIAFLTAKQMDEFKGELLSTKDLIVGDVVYVNGEGDWRGKICYLGDVHFAKGTWAGVALDHPLGNHDGTIKGRRYFQCPNPHGIMTRINKLSVKKLVPESMDAEKLGLYRDNPAFSDVYRERSPSPSRSNTPIRESSPSVSFSSYSTRRSQSPMGLSNSNFMTSYYNRSRSGSPTPNGLKLGDRVIVASSIGETKAGVLRFYGEVDFADGLWAGIELGYPLGKNDGTIGGREYFRCQHPHGLFVPAHKIAPSPANKLQHSRMGTKSNLKYIHNTQRAGSYDDYF